MSEDKLTGKETKTVPEPLPETDEQEAVDSGQSSEIQEEAADLTVEEQLAQAEAKAAEYLDGWQRARADFANARKRLERERIEAYSSAGVDYMTKLLPIIDDLGRALNSAPPEIASDPWFDGLDLVNRKLQSMLESINVKPIEAVGQPFDPNLHEALSLRQADDVDSGIVVEELQTGYRLGDKVIRPSLVNVSE